MAISWGAWEYSGGNGMRVGIDVDLSSVSHSSSSVTFTVRYYTQNQYSYNDGQTLNFGGSYAGASVNFNNNNGGGVVHRETKVYGYTYSNYGSSPGSRTFTVSLSGAFNGVTPSKSRTVSIPARPYAAPLPPFNMSGDRVNDGRIDLSWSRQIPGDGSRPYGVQELQGRTYSGDSWTGFGGIRTVSASATSYGWTGLSPNRAYNFRVRAYNSAGYSDWDYSQNVYMTAASPTGVSISSASPTSRTISWSAQCYRSALVKHQVQRQINDGSWTTLADDLSDTTESFSDNSSLTGYVRYRVRAWTNFDGGLADDWVTTAYYYSTPAAPTSISVELEEGSGDRVITWTANAYDEASVKHEVQRSVNGGAWQALTTSLAWNATSYEDTSLQIGSVRYRVRAIRGSLQSTFATSAEVSLSTVSGKHQLSWVGTQNLSRSIDTHLGMWAVIDLDKPKVRYILPTPSSSAGYALGKDEVSDRLLITEVESANTITVSQIDLGAPAANEEDAEVYSTNGVGSVTEVSAGRPFGGFRDVADEGTPRLHLGITTSTLARTFDAPTMGTLAQTTSSRKREFGWPNTGVGFDWDGTNFWSLGSAGNVYKHTDHIWDVDTYGQYIRAAYTSKDLDSGFETTIGAHQSVLGKRRAKIVVTTGAVASFGGVDTNGIYLAITPTGSGDPDLSDWHFQSDAGTPGENGTLVLNSVNLSGAAPPATNDFPEANPGQFLSAAAHMGTPIIRFMGDGDALMGAIANTQNTRDTYVLNGFALRSAASDSGGGLWQLPGDGVNWRLGDLKPGINRMSSWYSTTGYTLSSGTLDAYRAGLVSATPKEGLSNGIVYSGSGVFTCTETGTYEIEFITAFGSGGSPVPAGTRILTFVYVNKTSGTATTGNGNRREEEQYPESPTVAYGRVRARFNLVAGDTVGFGSWADAALTTSSVPFFADGTSCHRIYQFTRIR